MPNAAKSRAAKRIICYVTDGKTLRALDRVGSVLAKIREAVAAGADWIQLREKDLSGRDVMTLARSAVDLAANSGGRARVFVNDRLDIAITADASGIHLGGESLPVSDVARWCRGGNAPSDFMIGVSCHDLEGAREAEGAGASYVFFGPIFDTPAKRRFGPPQGVSKLAEVCRAARIPVIAIGGVNETNAGECFRAGASGIAAIRMFQDAGTPEELTRRIARLREI